MSATIQERAAVLPTMVSEKIVRFLDAGMTGQIILDVKEGRVLAYKITESGRVHLIGSSEIDRKGEPAQD